MRNIVILVLLSFTNVALAEAITIFAAASLTAPLKELQPFLENQLHSKIIFNFASSGTLFRQIAQGAAADLFLSANEEFAQKLISERKIKETDVAPFLSNELVIISPQNKKPLVINDLILPSIKKIAIGTIATVPAGKYAKEALINAKLYDHIKNKLVFGKDVLAVFNYVALDAVDAGIVYKTNLHKATNVTKGEIIPENLYQTANYPFVLLTTDAKKRRLLQNVFFSTTSKKIFEDSYFKTQW